MAKSLISRIVISFLPKSSDYIFLLKAGANFVFLTLVPGAVDLLTTSLLLIL
jgi:hypothetical protein